MLPSQLSGRTPVAAECRHHIRRIGLAANLLTRNGVIVLVRGASSNFVEVFADAPVEVCEQRDSRYAKCGMLVR